MRQRFGRHIAEPSWVPAHRVDAHYPDAETRSWLSDESSLTRRLQRLCGGDGFRVEVLRQGRETPMVNEAQSLGMPLRRLAWVREVCLCCGDTPWVFARTVIPLSTLTGSRAHLARLGNRPLGAVLFADPTMSREPMEVTRLARPDRVFPYFDGQPWGQQPIRGRRSRFCLDGLPLLVSEYFLPPFPPIHREIAKR